MKQYSIGICKVCLERRYLKYEVCFDCTNKLKKVKEKLKIRRL